MQCIAAGYITGFIMEDGLEPAQSVQCRSEQIRNSYTTVCPLYVSWDNPTSFSEWKFLCAGGPGGSTLIFHT